MNMGSIYKQFEKEQEKLRKEYRAAGMTEVQIDELYEYDKKQLSRDIAYQRWTQPLVSEDTDFEDDSQNALLKKFSDVFCIDMEPDQSVYLWWFDEIEDKNLLNKLLKLSVEDLELLDQLAFQELTQKEICSRTKKTQSSISQRIKTIRKKLRNSQ